ncbi:Hypothetical predicted protein [Pelobates cultripes]|uniref:Uncharacterized protein n=1 Tax=Pelobates cultripes TaxID=61616 RepID=A0AAD1TBC5_PELCU|nr:Hypothetical predicted protein [Pelobates cultripes]
MSDKLLCNFNRLISDLQKDVLDLGNRSAHMEHCMGEYEEAHNDMVDHIQNIEQELESCQTKLMDLKDQSRRQNIRLRGIPEALKQPDLMEYLMW